MRAVSFAGGLVALLPLSNVFAASVDISVLGDTTGIVVYSGTANVCNLSGSSCSSVGSGCGLASVSGAGVDVLTDDARVGFVEENFPFAVNQETLQADFQVGTDACNLIEISPDEPGAIRAASPN